jgi:hypothetical protein
MKLIYPAGREIIAFVGISLYPLGVYFDSRQKANSNEKLVFTDWCLLFDRPVTCRFYCRFPAYASTLLHGQPVHVHARKIMRYCVRFEAFTAMTMKNAVAQFVLHRRHITSPLQNPAC